MKETHEEAFPIDGRILFVRGYRVMLDADLAEVYGVSTKRLNEQVKRNEKRFPSRFMFQVSRRETVELVANCDRFERLKHSSSRPYAFTEHGAIMLASVLNSDRAIKASIAVVDAFVRIRELVATHKDLARKLEALENKYDSQFKVVFDAIRDLMTKPAPKPLQIKGFQDK